MEFLRQYGRSITVSIMSVLLVVSLTYIICMPVQAAQLGTIADLAAHVYERTDTDSNIVANVIMGYNFPILAEEADEAGNVWYLIETDMGVQGYIPAQGVIKITNDAQNEDTQVEDTPVQQTVPSEENENENENENNLPDDVKKQLLTLEVVNIRENPSTNEEILGKIPRGTTLDYIDTVTNTIGEVWYEVSYEDSHGFVKDSTVREIETPVYGTGSTQSSVVGMTAEDIDIGQLLETARQYQEESSVEVSVNGSAALDETQVRDQIIDYDDIKIEENTGETKKKLSVPRLDMVIILSFAGILLCAVIIYKSFKRMVKLLR